jgi:hypothetical protein
MLANIIIFGVPWVVKKKNQRPAWGQFFLYLEGQISKFGNRYIKYMYFIENFENFVPPLIHVVPPLLNPKGSFSSYWSWHMESRGRVPVKFWFESSISVTKLFEGYDFRTCYEVECEREREREKERSIRLWLMRSHYQKTPTFLSPTLLRKGNLSPILFYKMIHPLL